MTQLRTVRSRTYLRLRRIGKHCSCARGPGRQACPSSDSALLGKLSDISLLSFHDLMKCVHKLPIARIIIDLTHSEASSGRNGARRDSEQHRVGKIDPASPGSSYPPSKLPLERSSKLVHGSEGFRGPCGVGRLS